MALARFDRKGGADDALERLRKRMTQGRGGTSVDSKVYEDEPIVFTGAQMRRREQDPARAEAPRPGSVGIGTAPAETSRAARTEAAWPTTGEGALGSQERRLERQREASARRAEGGRRWDERADELIEHQRAAGERRRERQEAREEARGQAAEHRARASAARHLGAFVRSPGTQGTGLEEAIRPRSRVESRSVPERSTQLTIDSTWAERLSEGLGADLTRRIADGFTGLMREPLPKRYREVRKIAQQPAMWRAKPAKVFYEQARLMADYEDDHPYRGDYSRYFPSFQNMDDDQLRGYVTWRTAVRHGQAEQVASRTQVSYAFVYAYEILCGIGVEPGVEAMRLLASLPGIFPMLAEKLRPYLRLWISDYAVYHDLVSLLPVALERLEGGSEKTSSQASEAGEEESGEASRSSSATSREPAPLLYRAQRTHLSRLGLAPVESQAWNVDEIARSASMGIVALPWSVDGEDEYPTRQELAQAILACVPKTIASSRFFRDYPDDACAVLSAVFYRMVEHCAKHRTKGFFEGVFGKMRSRPYEMFCSALFFDPVTHPNAVVRKDDVDCYACYHGGWFLMSLCPDRTSSKLGDLVRDVDYVMRELYEYPHPLKEREVAKYLRKIIDEEAGRVLARRKANTIPELKIDRSSLVGIRAAAATTREALLVDEEREDLEESLERQEGSLWSAAPRDHAGLDGFGGVADLGDGEAIPGADAAPAVFETHGVPATAGDATAPTTAPSTHAGGSLGLTEEQANLLALLIAGEQVAQERGQTPMTMLVDAINERLFDILGDTAIEFVDDQPVLVEDYRDDVSALFE